MVTAYARITGRHITVKDGVKDDKLFGVVVTTGPYAGRRVLSPWGFGGERIIRFDPDSHIIDGFASIKEHTGRLILVVPESDADDISVAVWDLLESYSVSRADDADCRKLELFPKDGEYDAVVKMVEDDAAKHMGLAPSKVWL